MLGARLDRCIRNTYRCPYDAAHGSDLGQPEVENFGVPALSDENVRGLDVTMDDSSRMSGIQRISHLNAQIQNRFDL